MADSNTRRRRSSAASSVGRSNRSSARGSVQMETLAQMFTLPSMAALAQQVMTSDRLRERAVSVLRAADATTENNEGDDDDDYSNDSDANADDDALHGGLERLQRLRTDDERQLHHVHEWARENDEAQASVMPMAQLFALLDDVRNY